MNYQAQQMFAIIADAFSRCAAIATTEDSALTLEQRAERTPTSLDEGTHTERVVHWMRRRPGTRATRAELKQALSLADNSLSGAISRLKDRGVIEMVGRGRYRLRPGRS